MCPRFCRWSTFEPQFNWTSTVINEKALLVAIRSVNPQIPGKEPVIVQLKAQEGAETPCQSKATMSTELAIAAQQYTQKTEVPIEYQQFAKVFSKEESKCSKLGITQSSLKRAHLMQWTAMYIPLTEQRMKQYKSSSKMKLRKDISEYLSHHMHHPSSSSKEGWKTVTGTGLQKDQCSHHV